MAVVPKQLAADTSDEGDARYEPIPIGRIFLQLDNPRHVPVETEAEAINVLCDKEDVLPLARDIVKNGLSPLERFAVVPIGAKRGRKGSQTFHVAEGNRRICALKLLSDPDLAPARLRKSFDKLSEGWVPIATVSAAIFPTFDDVRIWLDRVHSGPQGGIGRLTWDAEQKQRFYGGNKNRLAQSLLDYAEREGFITASEREGKLTTAQRFLSNPLFRETLGVDGSNPEELQRNRPKPEFDTIVRQFVRDLVEGKAVTSRMNSSQIVGYGRPLAELAGVTATRVDNEPLDASEKPRPRASRRKPKQPPKARHVQHEQEIAMELKTLANGKLESLYYSITSIELEHHTPLVCIGAWAFFESLSARAGRNDNTSFKDFFSKQRLNNYGFSDTVVLRDALERMMNYGNATKHHPISATFNGDQLNNDMIALSGVILACISAAAGTL